MSIRKPTAIRQSAPAPAKTPARTALSGLPGAKSEASEVEPGRITAQQALANTRALLRAKHDKARKAPNYPVGEPVHPGAQGPHGVAMAQPEHAPTERLNEALHGHAHATERGDESKREQS